MSTANFRRTARQWRLYRAKQLALAFSGEKLEVATIDRILLVHQKTATLRDTLRLYCPEQDCNGALNNYVQSLEHILKDYDTYVIKAFIAHAPKKAERCLDYIDDCLEALTVVIEALNKIK